MANKVVDLAKFRKAIVRAVDQVITRGNRPSWNKHPTELDFALSIGGDLSVRQEQHMQEHHVGCQWCRLRRGSIEMILETITTQKDLIAFLRILSSVEPQVRRSSSSTEIARMSRSTLEHWLFSTLDSTGDSRSGQLGFDLVFNEYHNSSSRAQTTLRFVIIDALRDLANNAKSQWLGEAGDNLLLLVELVFENRTNETDRTIAIRILKKLANTEWLEQVSMDDGRGTLRQRAEIILRSLKPSQKD